MQLMPATARRYGSSNPLDPAENLRAGARYLRDLLALFDNNLELALAAYNAGENAVLRYGRKLPPYAETRRYVPMVVAHYQQLSRRPASH
jgi:soluble lytic murein transglycosylase-like protein